MIETDAGKRARYHRRLAAMFLKRRDEQAARGAMTMARRYGQQATAHGRLADEFAADELAELGGAS